MNMGASTWFHNVYTCNAYMSYWILSTFIIEDSIKIQIIFLKEIWVRGIALDTFGKSSYEYDCTKAIS
jgi:hypothetical protein